MKTNEIKDASSFLARVEKMKKDGGVDLSAGEDLSIAVMNLISLEEHFFFTGAKTKDEGYYDLSGEIRSMRTRLMEGLVEKHEGETWCATKHLLSSSMRLIETGNRYIASGDKKKAGEYFADAYRLYTIFWALKTKLVSPQAVVSSSKEMGDKGWSLETLVEKLADCCDERDAEATRK
ncbi:MAG: hypothetical protein COV91_06180 [Candidatus Taylorbacteria bacterium CG11_big_fil_rev_8_21_14_0_20_46_11]|uniref:Uncharacterized protein n=1 Tax=Candidatus Taylorbacteria bacterium CG11_big_fil_rev_8_21_14_0_20_46_11 TaxID=1975025 RepID=A0A2H0K9X0_9BACT|nr:MAG: hypothetical protein COV91_06180 [Candidatus Taylorbacteria bacterium CG11_big_fil_rev_8_21_14_0_20_46_11]